MATERHEPRACPHCGVKLEAVTGVRYDSLTPPTLEPGDHTMCCYCFHILRWGGDVFRKVSPGVEAEVFSQSKLLRDFRETLREKQKHEVN